MMRRYRKGEIFRPPTAAESAASADALEAFRRRSPASQEPLARGSDIVKTPEGGIAGRDGTTIYSATCTRCVEIPNGGDKTIVETDEEILVFNLSTVAVAEYIYTMVRLTLGGTLCVGWSGGGVHWGKLDANLAYDDNTGVTVSIWTGKPASDTGNNIDNVVISELLMASGQLDSGSAVRIQFIDGKWFVVGAPC